MAKKAKSKTKKTKKKAKKRRRRRRKARLRKKRARQRRQKAARPRSQAPSKAKAKAAAPKRKAAPASRLPRSQHRHRHRRRAPKPVAAAPQPAPMAPRPAPAPHRLRRAGARTGAASGCAGTRAVAPRHRWAARTPAATAATVGRRFLAADTQRLRPAIRRGPACCASTGQVTSRFGESRTSCARLVRPVSATCRSLPAHIHGRLVPRR